MAKRKSSIANLLDPSKIKANTQAQKERLDKKLETERSIETVERVPPQLLKVDEVYKQTIRPQSLEEAVRFKQLIEEEGIRDALIVYEQAGDLFIVDGHHRLKAALELSIDRVPIKRKTFDDQADATQWMLRNQLGRRNLNDAERTVIASALRDEISKEAKERQLAGKKMGENDLGTNLPQGRTNDVIAKLANVSPTNVKKVKKIQESGDKELLNEVLAGGRSIHSAYQAVKSQPGNVEEVKSNFKSSISERAEVFSKDTLTLFRKMEKWKNGQMTESQIKKTIEKFRK